MDFSKLNGLVPAVVQDAETREVLMVGFMNAEALDRTLASGFATFFSRSRGALWLKGETSGNRLQVEEVLVDCDEDTVLLRVRRLGDGNVCHTGERTCFSARASAKPLVRARCSVLGAPCPVPVPGAELDLEQSEGGQHSAQARNTTHQHDAPAPSTAHQHDAPARRPRHRALRASAPAPAR